ncbi:MAG: chloride channel protein [Thiolinea sp.]
MGNILAKLYGLMDQLRLRLANPEAVMLLSLLGAATGLLTALLISMFRFLLEWSQQLMFLSERVDDFESLPWYLQLLLPIAGGLLLAILFQSVTQAYRQVGVLHVIERMQYHQGRMPWPNMVMQFIGAALAILSGHSVGREGPSVHMGGYSGSWLAQSLRLPNNSTRTLVACGTAAAIGASFYTPLAGIIFAMEVILQQYTVQGFIPVILAAVSGTYLSLTLMEDEIFFDFNLSSSNIGYDWPLVMLLGISIGVLSTLFNVILIHLTRHTAKTPIWARFTLAGLLMGCIAWWVPQTMGIGYDTLDKVLNAQLGLEMMAVILLAKFLATLACLGLGIPGGVIGPLMFIGSLAGGVLVTLSLHLDIGALIPSEPTLYPLLGMGAMFAASLQAPLAGLTAVMELSGNADIILPAMLAIVSASLTNKVIFHHDSLFLSLLRARGLDHATSPVMQRLRSIGVASMMNRSFSLCENQLSLQAARVLLNRGIQWLVITDKERQPREMVRALDLQSFIETHPDADTVTLTEIPGKRLQLAALSVRASLQEGLDLLDAKAAEALYLHRERGGVIYGVITRSRIEKAFY